jgi:hypothetical protein
MRPLGAIRAKSNEVKPFTVGLVRQQNKICYHLSNALVTGWATLAAPPRIPARNQVSGRAR